NPGDRSKDYVIGCDAAGSSRPLRIADHDPFIDGPGPSGNRVDRQQRSCKRRSRERQPPCDACQREDIVMWVDAPLLDQWSALERPRPRSLSVAQARKEQRGKGKIAAVGKCAWVWPHGSRRCSWVKL